MPCFEYYTPKKWKTPFFYHWKTNGKYIQPCFHYGLHQIAMRVETTDKALTKKKKNPHPTMCVLKKKIKNVNHWHPITVVLVEATNELWPKKKKNLFCIWSSNEGPSIIDGHEATSNFITKFFFFFFFNFLIKDLEWIFHSAPLCKMNKFFLYVKCELNYKNKIKLNIFLPITSMSTFLFNCIHAHLVSIEYRL